MYTCKLNNIENLKITLKAIFSNYASLNNWKSMGGGMEEMSDQQNWLATLVNLTPLPKPQYMWENIFHISIFISNSQRKIPCIVLVLMAM